MEAIHDGHELVPNPIAKGNILMVCTQHTDFGEGKKTGADTIEIGVPFVTFKSNGFDVTIASPGGGEIPLDPLGKQKAESEDAPPEVHRFLKNDACMQMLKKSVPLENVKQLEGVYSAIFIPGGHGANFDLPENKKLISLLAEANAKGIIIAAICHGPAALVNVPEKPDGTDGWMVKRRRIVCYSNEEEKQGGTASRVPWLMEDKLRERGADVVVGPPGSECAEADGKLITAQNPSSVFKMATLVLEALTANYPEDTSTPSTFQESVIGAKKSGTGSVAQALGTNPPQQGPGEVSRLR